MWLTASPFSKKKEEKIDQNMNSSNEDYSGVKDETSTDSAGNWEGGLPLRCGIGSN